MKRIWCVSLTHTQLAGFVILFGEGRELQSDDGILGKDHRHIFLPVGSQECFFLRIWRTSGMMSPRSNVPFPTMECEPIPLGM